MSNRDLVIFLGSEFEKRGYDYLEKVHQRDPLFYQHYLYPLACRAFVRQAEGVGSARPIHNCQGSGCLKLLH